MCNYSCCFQRAQATGLFDKIEGVCVDLIWLGVFSKFEFQRGKPFRRTSDEMNPFVAREEFLMNRIVRKNDAAPPWVELQKGMRRNYAEVVS